MAISRIRVGREIGSAALVADGYHARVDGWTSLAVFAGALGIWAGYPLADSIVGLLVSAAIFVLVYQSLHDVVESTVASLEQEVPPIAKLIGEPGADDPPREPGSSLDPGDHERDAGPRRGTGAGPDS